MDFSLYSRLTIPDADRFISLIPEDAVFIHSFLQKNKITSTMEIGLAYGCSAAYILAATQSIHYAIDPFQETFDHLGIRNIKKLGLDHLLRHEAGCSHEILPRLLNEGKRFDFIFIDGDHKFDSIFIDFYYADLLLNQNGYILFHDIWMNSTKMICAWIKTNKANYRFIPTPPHNFAFYQKKGRDDRAWDHFNKFNIPKTPEIVYRRLKSKVSRLFRRNKDADN